MAITSELLKQLHSFTGNSSGFQTKVNNFLHHYLAYLVKYLLISKANWDAELLQQAVLYCYRDQGGVQIFVIRARFVKNKTTYLLLYKLTKVKEKSKELIKICNYLQTWWFLHSVSYIKSSRDRSKRLNSNLHAWKNK